jgi:hypothetical protein
MPMPRSSIRRVKYMVRGSFVEGAVLLPCLQSRTYSKEYNTEDAARKTPVATGKKNTQWGSVSDSGRRKETTACMQRANTSGISLVINSCKGNNKEDINIESIGMQPTRKTVMMAAVCYCEILDFILK